ncbi:uncharacterized protein LOC113563440 [Ooceraea biroi]|uniref:uncharacterized protein LOC113563440 n=1 Tax=Ooceraea biroi TaxID=2015173 RepID=UPI000F094A51|nr:uncharacterized protein LOC113563440 [Ooceraea biroi]
MVKVAKRSGHLQGPYVKTLKEAAASIRAALTVIAERMGTEAPSLSKENTALRGKVESLKSQIGELRDTISLMGRATVGTSGDGDAWNGGGEPAGGYLPRPARQGEEAGDSAEESGNGGGRPPDGGHPAEGRRSFRRRGGPPGRHGGQNYGLHGDHGLTDRRGGGGAPGGRTGLPPGEGVEGSGVKITRPVKKVELRVRRLEDAATEESVSRAVAAAGGCDPRDVEIGTIQRSSDGLGTSWIRLPAQAGEKVADLGRIRVGWAWAPISVLEPRPLMCYRCLAKGHVQATCPSREDRRDLCYRCGAAGHRARGCVADPKCPLCTGLGRRADHRLGSAACAPPSKGGSSGVQRGAEMRAQGGARPTEAAPRPQSVTSPAPSQAAPSAGAALEPTPANGDKGGPAPPREEEPKPRRATRSMGRKKAEEKDDEDERGLEEPAMDVE